jgi:hypothetical protein
MQLWRINIKPDSEQGLDATEFCVDRGIVGIGWGIGTMPTTKDDYRKIASEAHKASYGSWLRATNAILDGLSVGDLIWTRNRSAVYYLGRISGEWEYRHGEEYSRADVANVRPCSWVKVGSMDHVPGSVINSFGPNATIQRVTDSSAALYSSLLFSELRGEELTKGAAAGDILGLLSAEDLEDVVAIYLQVTRRLVMFPSTCKKDTMTVECVFADLDTGERVGLQVKSGQTAIVVADYSSFNGQMYLFAACGVYVGQSSAKCVCLDPAEVRESPIPFPMRPALIRLVSSGR